MGLGFKARGICKYSFLKSFFFFYQFGVVSGEHYFFLFQSTSLSFTPFQVSRSGPRSKENAKNSILFCVTTEWRRIITWPSPPLTNLQWPRFVWNLAQTCIVIKGCSHEIRKAWQNCTGSLITKIWKHFFLNDKDSLFTLVENKLAHVYSEKLWS